MTPALPRRRRDRDPVPGGAAIHASISRLPGPVSKPVAAAPRHSTVMLAMPPMLTIDAVLGRAAKHVIMERRDQRRTLAAGRHVAAPQVADHGQARELGNRVRIADLPGKRHRAGGPMAQCLAMAADGRIRAAGVSAACSSAERRRRELAPVSTSSAAISSSDATPGLSRTRVTRAFSAAGHAKARAASTRQPASGIRPGQRRSRPCWFPTSGRRTSPCDLTRAA